MCTCTVAPHASSPYLLVVLQGVCAALQQLLDPRGSGGGSLIESVDADGWRVIHHAAKAG